MASKSIEEALCRAAEAQVKVLQGTVGVTDPSKWVPADATMKAMMQWAVCTAQVARPTRSVCHGLAALQNPRLWRSTRLQG